MDVVALKDMTLGELRSDLAVLCKQSGWWTESDALDYTFFAQVGGHGIKLEAEGDFILGGRILITVDMPTTAEEVKTQYQGLLKSMRSAPIRLTGQQEALLHLVQRMPASSWPERFKAWKELCANSKRKFHPYDDWRSMSSSYHNARKRAKLGWNKQPNLPDEESTA